MKNKYQIFPIFSKPIYLKILELDLKKIILNMENDFHKAGMHRKEDNLSVENHSYVSKNIKILEKNKFSFLKEKIIEEFNIYVYNVLEYTNKFKLINSWFTKTTKDQLSDYHCHKNSMFSGVLYLQTNENSGKISFLNYHSGNSYNLICKNWNIFNSPEFLIQPVNGLIVFFPSEVYHKILKNNSNIVRHSLAFTFSPVGKYGSGDNEILIKT